MGNRLALLVVAAAFAVAAIAACSSQNGLPPTGGGGGGGVVDAATVMNEVAANLYLTIVTGSDSLRLDSEATATITYADGASESLSLPFYSNGTTGPLNFTQGGTTHIATTLKSAQPIASIQISMVSHPLTDLETNDSWTIQEVRASVAHGDGGAPACVLDRPGKTITDGQPLVVSAGGCAVGGLQILVVTGGDDLRGDSTATVSVAYQGGLTDDEPLTKSFPVGSTVEVDLGLASAQPIESVTFAMQSHPGTFESSDSWNIKQVEVLTVTGDAGAPTCVLNALGKTITDNVTLVVMPGGCPTMTPDGGDGDAGDDASTDAGSDGS